MSRFRQMMAFLVGSCGLILILNSSCGQSYPQGKALYDAYCGTCHMEEGQGLRGLFPPVAQSDYLVANRAKLPCIIRYGLQDSIYVNGRLYDQPMAAIPSLSEIQIHNILNYIHQAWNSDQPYFTPKEVQEALKNCQ